MARISVSFRLRSVVESGGIMQSNLQKQVHSANFAEESNFRVFDGENYSSSSVTESTSHVLVVYSMISIFNGHFVKAAPVNHMVAQADHFFVNQRTIAPIFYLNSRQLQEVTQAVMYKPEVLIKNDPLGKAEKNWLARFHEAEKSQQDKGVIAKRKVLPWGDLLSLEQYRLIQPFFNAIICSENAAECSKKLASAFPRAEARDLLISEIENERLFQKTGTVVDTFVAHYRVFHKDSNDSFSAVSKEDQRMLREYLDQEYSVFLMLACLDTLQSIQSAFASSDVELAVSLSESSPVQAVLTYPISASRNKDGLAEKSFSLFLAIQKLYIKYAANLSLPTLNRPLLVVDSLVSSKQANLENKSTCSSSSDRDTQPLKSFMKQELKPSSFASYDSPRDETSLVSSRVGIYQMSSFDITANKILKALEAENYLNTGVDEFEVYRNGVQCTLKLLPHSDTHKVSDEKSVLRMISKNVQNVVESNELSFELRPKFHYKGSYYQLAIVLTQLNVASTSTLTAGPV